MILMKNKNENNKNIISPGKILHYDFRLKNETTEIEILKNKSSLRLIQWNIERGYQLNKIIKTLQNLNADIICVQEIDINCERSQNIDIGKEIAKSLNMNYLFICEFEEIYSEIR